MVPLTTRSSGNSRRLSRMRSTKDVPPQPEPLEGSMMSKSSLSLPAEIRNMIYAELIPSQIKLMVIEPEACSDQDLQCFGLPPKSALPSQVLMIRREFGDEERRAQLPSILAFCYSYRSISSETRPLLYPVISVRSCLSYSNNPLWQYNKMFLERLEHLHIWNEFYTCKDDVILKRHPRLKSLTLRFLGRLRYDVGSEGMIVPRQKGVVKRVRHVLNSPYSKMDGVFFEQTMSSSFEVVCVVLSSEPLSENWQKREGLRIDLETLSEPTARQQ